MPADVSAAAAAGVAIQPLRQADLPDVQVRPTASLGLPRPPRPPEAAAAAAATLLHTHTPPPPQRLHKYAQHGSRPVFSQYAEGAAAVLEAAARGEDG